jgi:predicted nucleotidyltransferase
MTKIVTHQEQILEQRRQEALAVAQQCIQLLQQDFRAKEVILFGSLAGDGPWHWRSDLDLAVRGMSDDAIWNAYSTLEKIAPSWLKIDLVALERVPTRVADRILKLKSMSDNKYLALKSRLEDEMIALENNVEKLMMLLEQAETIPEIALTPALASYIADFYTGCERISERVAVTFDDGLPRSDNWHQELLKQVAEWGGDNRPPLWSGSLLLELDEYRKFRHLARHIYNIELKLDKVLALAQNVQPVLTKIKQAISLFNDWLDQQAP